MSKQLRINSVSRVTADAVIETIELHPGVNILEGSPNSGKTVWLKIIDYLMGDTGQIEEVLTNEDTGGKPLYEKYIAASMNISIGETILEIERKWTEKGARSKVYINGTAILAQDFSDYLLTELEIPVLHFPKGNPFTDRAWPSLSWRMMLRHIFRQENYWSDLADKQPESEQHAVLTQFLGIADKMFSQQFGDVVNKRKQLLKLEAEKEQFSAILDNIGKSMASPNEIITFLTRDTIKKSIATLEDKIKELLEKRQQIIQGEIEKIENENKEIENFILQKTAERATLIEDIEKVNKKQKGLIARISEFKGIHNSIKQEVNKLVRTKEAGSLFADLKITHCPACDQSISQTASGDENHCFLCHQSTNREQSENRIDFEIAQLTGEKDEIQELISSLERDENELIRHEHKLRYGLTMVEREIAPLRNRMTALVSPVVGNIDAERGRYEEQIEGHKRMLKNLDYKDELIKNIDALNSEISKLDVQLNAQEETINYEEVSSIFEEQMAYYLNELKKGNPERWPHKRPTFRIGEKGFMLKVNEGKWSNALGGTSKLYFFFAYHYGLLALTKMPNFNYPGLLIIDFPPELPNTETRNIVFSENYVVEPFVELCNKITNLQVIIAGSSFRKLEGVNNILISHD